MDKDKMLTPAEIAERLQLAERTIYEWLRTRRLPGAFKLGGRWRMWESDLDEFIEEQRKGGL